MSNRISVTLTPYQNNMVKAISKITGQSESKVIAAALKKDIEQIPPDKRDEIIQAVKK